MNVSYISCRKMHEFVVLEFWCVLWKCAEVVIVRWWIVLGRKLWKGLYVNRSLMRPRQLAGSFG